MPNWLRNTSAGRGGAGGGDAPVPATTALHTPTLRLTPTAEHTKNGRLGMNDACCSTKSDRIHSTGSGGGGGLATVYTQIGIVAGPGAAPPASAIPTDEIATCEAEASAHVWVCVPVPPD